MDLSCLFVLECQNTDTGVISWLLNLSFANSEYLSHAILLKHKLLEIWLMLDKGDRSSMGYFWLSGDNKKKNEESALSNHHYVDSSLHGHCSFRDFFILELMRFLESLRSFLL